MSSLADLAKRLAALEEEMAELREENRQLKSKKVAKPKRAATNATGPAEFNTLVKSVWREMVATKGVDVDDLSDEDFKTAAKDAGVTYHAAMKEAGIRHRMMEKGLSHAEAEAELNASKASAKEKKVAKEKKEEKPIKSKPASKPKKAEPTIEEQMEALGMSIREVDGAKYFIDNDSGEAYSMTETGEFGERAGVYDADSDVIDTTA